MAKLKFTFPFSGITIRCGFIVRINFIRSLSTCITYPLIFFRRFPFIFFNTNIHCFFSIINIVFYFILFFSISLFCSITLIFLFLKNLNIINLCYPFIYILIQRYTCPRVIPNFLLISMTLIPLAFIVLTSSRSI